MREQMKVIDKGGDWLLNTSEYRFINGLTGVIFEPGVPTKVNADAWTFLQEMIQPCADPMTGDPAPATKNGGPEKIASTAPVSNSIKK